MWKIRLRHWYSHERPVDEVVPALLDVVRDPVGRASNHLRFGTRVPGSIAALGREPLLDCGEGDVPIQ